MIRERNHPESPSLQWQNRLSGNYRSRTGKTGPRSPDADHIAEL